MKINDDPVVSVMRFIYRQKYAFAIVRHLLVYSGVLSFVENEIFRTYFAIELPRRESLQFALGGRIIPLISILQQPTCSLGFYFPSLVANFSFLSVIIILNYYLDSIFKQPLKQNIAPSQQLGSSRSQNQKTRLNLGAIIKLRYNSLKNQDMRIKENNDDGSKLALP